MTAHPGVEEAAAVGVPDPPKGEAVWAFWVPPPGTTEHDRDISAKLRRPAFVAHEVGEPFAPERLFTGCRRLPKTRSAKILRRADPEAAALDIDTGDLSGAEDPEAVDEIRAVVASESSVVSTTKARTTVWGLRGGSRKTEKLFVEGNVGALLEVLDRLGVRVDVPAHASYRGLGVLLANCPGHRAVRLDGDLANLVVDESFVLGRGVDGPRS